MAYGGFYLVCRADGRRWEWQPAAWREIVKKPVKDDSNAESGETADAEAKERGFLSRIVGRKAEKIPAQ